MISKRRLMQRAGGNEDPSHDDDEGDIHGSSFLPDWNATTATTAPEDADDSSDDDPEIMSESETEDEQDEGNINKQQSNNDNQNVGPTKPRRPRSQRISRGLRRQGSERRKVKDRSLSVSRQKSDLNSKQRPTPVRRSTSRSNVHHHHPPEEPTRQNSDRSLGSRQNSFHNKPSRTTTPSTAMARRLSARGLTPASLDLSSHSTTPPSSSSSSLKMTPVRGNNSFRGELVSDNEITDEEQKQRQHRRRPSQNGRSAPKRVSSKSLLMDNADDDEDDRYLFVE